MPQIIIAGRAFDVEEIESIVLRCDANEYDALVNYANLMDLLPVSIMMPECCIEGRQIEKNSDAFRISLRIVPRNPQ